MLKLTNKIRFIIILVIIILVTLVIPQHVDKVRGESIYSFPPKNVTLTRWREIIKIDENGDGTVWTFIKIKFSNKTNPNDLNYIFIFNLQYHPIKNLVIYPNEDYSDQKNQSSYLSAHKKTMSGTEGFAHLERYYDILYINVSSNASKKYERFSFAFQYTVPGMAKKISEYFEASNRWELCHSINADGDLKSLINKVRLWISLPCKAYIAHIQGFPLDYSKWTPTSIFEITKELHQYLEYGEWGGINHTTIPFPIDFTIFNNSLLLYSRVNKKIDFVIDYDIPNPEIYETTKKSLYLAIASIILTLSSTIYMHFRKRQQNKWHFVYLLIVIFVLFFIFYNVNQFYFDDNGVLSNILIALFAGFVSGLITILIYNKIEQYRWEEANTLFFIALNNTCFLAFYKILDHLQLIPKNFDNKNLGTLVKRVGTGRENNAIESALMSFNMNDYVYMKNEFENLYNEIDEIIHMYSHKLRPEQHAIISKIVTKTQAIRNMCDLIAKSFQIPVAQQSNRASPILASLIQELCDAFATYIEFEKGKFKEWGYIS